MEKIKNPSLEEINTKLDFLIHYIVRYNTSNMRNQVCTLKDVFKRIDIGSMKEEILRSSHIPDNLKKSFSLEPEIMRTFCTDSDTAIQFDDRAAIDLKELENIRDEIFEMIKRRLPKDAYDYGIINYILEMSHEKLKTLFS